MKIKLVGLLLLVVTGFGQAQTARSVWSDVVYKQIDTTRLRLDIYLPDSGQKPFPVIVWLHGGGWRQGSKANPRPNDPLLRHGYAVVSVQYRFTNQAIYPTQLIDCKDAVRYVSQQAARYGLDPDRIGVWGSSAGGHLAALLGTTADNPRFGRECVIQGVSDRVRAVVDECGPTNFRRLAADLKKMDDSDDLDAPSSVFYGLFGGPISQRRKLAKLGGASTFVSRDDAAFLLLHGQLDTVVPVGQSILLHYQLRRKGVFSELHLIPNRGHDVRKAEVMDWIMPFLANHLKGRI